MNDNRIALGIAIRSTVSTAGLIILIAIVATLFKPYLDEHGASQKALTTGLFLAVCFWLFYRTSLSTIRAVKRTRPGISDKTKNT